MLTAEYDYKMDIEVQREEAFENGMKSGKIEGENRVNELITHLTEDGRIEDLKRSAKDKAFQEKLMKEYNI